MGAVALCFNTGATQFSGTSGTERARFDGTTGNLVVGGTTPTTNALVDLQSTTMAFCPPRMTTTQKNAISSPSEGMVIYDLTLHKLSVYTGAAWETVTSL